MPVCHMYTQSQKPVFCSVTLHLIPWRQGLSLHLELGWSPGVFLTSHSSKAIPGFHVRAGDLDSGPHDEQQGCLHAEPSGFCNLKVFLVYQKEDLG